jgi:hypothetical protein
VTNAPFDSAAAQESVTLAESVNAILSPSSS